MNGCIPWGGTGGGYAHSDNMVVLPYYALCELSSFSKNVSNGPSANDHLYMGSVVPNGTDSGHYPFTRNGFGLYSAL